MKGMLGNRGLNQEVNQIIFPLMASLFSKNPAIRAPLPPYSIKRIEKEIEHLRNRQSTRHLQKSKWNLARVASTIAVGTLLWLFFMDPFLYAYHKGDAIRAYLYLRHYGNDKEVQALVGTRILSDSEVQALNHRDGSFREYFANPDQAYRTTDAIVNYMNGLTHLRLGQYDELDPIGKLRYLLFYRIGLLPPTDWSGLTPRVDE